jgi:hypothetical protein
MVSLRAMFLALGDGQLNLGHEADYPAPGTPQRQNIRTQKTQNLRRGRKRIQ